MPFEFDSRKSTLNKSKHGIDFGEAQELWSDENRLETVAQSATEPRFQVLGLIRGVLWSAFITYRGANARIISVRRARREERKQYHEA